MLRLSDIRINHISRPKGIQGEISVSYQIQSDHQKVRQTCYQIQIAGEEGFEAPVLDTGAVKSDSSINIRVPDITFDSLCSYGLRVKIWDNHGEESEWESTAFMTALSEEQKWKADFITAEQLKDKNHSPATILQGEFYVEKKLKEAVLVSTAQGLYQTFLNGNRVGEEELAPGWTAYHKRLLYQTYEVTELIVPGKNIWSALVGAGWYKGDVSYERIHNFYGEYASFSGELFLRYEDGTEDIVLTDTTWKGADSAILFSDIYDGEVYDARLEQPINWRDVQVTRQVPGQILPQYDRGVSIQETAEPKEILTTPKEEQVIDFGQNLSGWVEFQVSGEPGDVVELVCFETLDAAGNVYLENLRTAKQTIQYTLKGEGREKYHPHFTYQGFRYVWVKEYPGTLRKENFKALVLYSDMKKTGTFSCSEPLLNQFQNNIMWSLKGNSVHIPTDCPQRDERLGWTGDVQIFCNTACYLMDMYEFYRKWLCDVAAEQKESGAVTDVVPSVLVGEEPDSFSGASGWGDVAVVLPWILYQETGDRSIIRAQYKSMKAWIDFVAEHMEDSIFSFGAQYGDWLALDAEEGSYHGATPSELTSAAYFAYVTGLFVKMAKAVGETADAEKYEKEHRSIVRHFRGRYYMPNGRMSIQTQTAHVLALCFDLAPKKYKQKTIDALIELLKQWNMHLSTGFLGTPFIMHALSENGHKKEAYDLLMKKDFPSWLYQVKQGATTIWEHWDGLKPDGNMWSADMNSFNHYSYGSVGKWLYEICAGLKRDEKYPGYKHFYIEPQPGGGLSYAETTHLTEYGEIKVRWEKEDKQMKLQIRIPHNTSATVVLERADLVETDGEPAFVRTESGYKAEVYSGSYLMKYDLTE